MRGDTTPFSAGFRNLDWRKWWVVYLGLPLLLTGTATLLVPGLFVESYVWQYLWGPVVADAAGHPVTYSGVTARTGYNPFNTLTYVVGALYALPGLRRFITGFRISVDSRLVFALSTILVAGGVMRALEDAALLPDPLSHLFITPSIYFVISALTLVALFSGSMIRDRVDVPGAVLLSVTALGTVWSLIGVSLAVDYVLRSGTSFQPMVLLLAPGGALLFAATFYFIGSSFGDETLTHPMILLLVFGQMLDASQNLIGVGWYDYTPKLLITSRVYELTGFAGSTFVLKLTALLGVVWLLDSTTEPIDSIWNWLLVFGALAVGLPQGARGTLRIALGV